MQANLLQEKNISSTEILKTNVRYKKKKEINLLEINKPPSKTPKALESMK